MSPYDLSNKGFSTKAIHSGYVPSKWPGHPVVPGILLSSTFEQSEPGKNYGYDYSRSGNPTREVLESCLAAIECGNYGLAFSSGLGATTTILMLLKCGDEVLCMDDVYGGTNRLFNKVICNLGLSFKMVDFCDEGALESSIVVGKTKMVWVESPTNPLLKVIDIEKVGKFIKTKDPNIIYVVDNTFATPYFQNPLKLGADIVMHSATKYLNGHSDVVMGCAMLNDPQLHEKLLFLQNAVGAIPSPFDCYLVNRGLKTLELRMKRHESTAMNIAKFLKGHKNVLSVNYPGLESHPQHEIVKKQSSGFGGMISFVIKGEMEDASKFIKNLKFFTLAESLGGYESLVELPSIMTHASVPPEQRKELGISDTLVRLSVGLEDPKDLIEDIKQALENH